MEEYFIGLFFIIAVIMIIVVIARYKKARREIYSNDPANMVRAEITAKSMELPKGTKTKHVFRMICYDYNHLVTFSTESGDLKFDVLHHDYLRLEVGMEGELRYRNKQFLGFKALDGSFEI